MVTKQQKGRGGRLRNDNLLVRVKTVEKQTFQEAADVAGVPLSAWVRERLRWAATKELQESGREVAFLNS
jgi:hypothetical protein